MNFFLLVFILIEEFDWLLICLRRMFVLYLLLSIILFFVYLYFKFTKPRHPFKPKPFVKPQEKREYSKQIYSTKPGVVPDNLDAIVIGSGIGGLSIAGLLAKQGRRVLLLEQHDIGKKKKKLIFKSWWMVKYKKKN